MGSVHGQAVYRLAHGKNIGGSSGVRGGAAVWRAYEAAEHQARVTCGGDQGELLG